MLHVNTLQSLTLAGAVELLLLKGFSFPLLGRWPTVWHRLYAYEILTYYLYAFPGYAIL